jgi:two-component system, LytTR family, response regulator
MDLAVLVIDDDPVANATLAALFSNDVSVAVVGRCADAATAIETIGRVAPDVVVLDADLPDHDAVAMAIVATLPERPLVVYVADHGRHARRAFDLDALDYLLVPIDPARLHRTISRARERLAWRNTARAETPMTTATDGQALPRHRDRVMVKVDGRVLLLRFDEIEWVESAGNYLVVHAGRTTHTIRHTMASMERELGPDRFIRIHRSHLVNIDRIAELHPLFDGDYQVVLRSGARLTMSRGYHDRMQAHLGRAL